jgi:NAD(P)-dependent dehydrogenase (short-subunit alcohol dehydrogenase family)
MDLQLRGTSALVTGAGSGIGRAVARARYAGNPDRAVYPKSLRRVVPLTARLRGDTR